VKLTSFDTAVISTSWRETIGSTAEVLLKKLSLSFSGLIYFSMKRVLIIVYSIIFIILIGNILYYENLYNKQIGYIFELLDRQVQIVGLTVDETNNGFLSDLNQINFSEDLTSFFTSDEKHRSAVDKMKLFFAKYENFITSIRYYDNERNEFTLKKDSESDSGEWLEQSFVLHVQSEIFNMEKLATENRKYNYYLPVIDPHTNAAIGNIVVTIDFQKYFREIFTTYNLQDYQWQWVVSDSGEIIYDNFGKVTSYSELDKITSGLAEGSVENVVHNAVIDGKKREIISSYYSTQLLQRDIGLVFSAPTAFFQKYIFRNSLIIVFSTLILIQAIILVFLKYLKSYKSDKAKLVEEKKKLTGMFERMPAGIIIHNKKREIIGANEFAAGHYSFDDPVKMQGTLFTERPLPENDIDQESKSIHPDQLVVVEKDNRETVLFRNSIPADFIESGATMEMLVDITSLEQERKQELNANMAKSEFLNRISYEIRTPLNGIIGMTDVLNDHELQPEIKDAVRLLRRSTEVLENIVDDIQDFSRIESGKMVLDEVPFSLREEISYCTDLAKTTASGKNINLSVSISDNVPDALIGDPFRIRQILTNLLQHSVRNTDSGEVSLKCLLKSRKGNSLVLFFELADTGLSFDKASLKKMFGDLMNIDSKIFRCNDDSLFGTMLSRELVELMGGKLYAESPSGLYEDSGTKISFNIVVCPDERIAKDLRTDEIKSFDTIKALVIASPNNRDEEITGALHKLGMKITVTTFMKSTVSQLRSNLSSSERYNLIFLFDDERLDGFSAANALMENNLSKDFVIMMVSSNDKRGNYLKCNAMGIDQYLIKPLSGDDLVNAVRSCFPSINMNTENDQNRKNIKILIVDDNPMNRKVLGAMLGKMGYSCDIAEDGYTGYLQARAKQYDLIFMDLVLPEIDGFEATRNILRMDKSVKIVAFTADNLPETRKKAELCGITDFICKPVKTDDLKRLLARHFK
jgi:signal transduction histidine kinase/DNA-binding response OmpR family regulator